ncbi:MAG TPA: glycosyltransferase [Pyrinomonadaceae bacterium]|nr:glycosyltransferase [Pyrinomonadaceae bacterium]
MKLIVSYLEALRTYVSREFYYIMSDLVSIHGWRHVETGELMARGGNLGDNLYSEFGELPEIILFWESYELIEKHAADIYLLNCRKFVFADDLHWFDEHGRIRKSLGFALSDGVLATYGYCWDHFYPEFCGSKRVVWVPHATSPDFMIPYNPQAQNFILLSGAMSFHYPLRQQLKDLHELGSYAIVHQQHPGYYTGYDYQNDEMVGTNFARKLNSYRTAFTDALVYRYVVAKYFEIPATGALLLADEAVEEQLSQLGFNKYQHYVPVSAENLEEQIQFVLDERNHEQLDQIRKAGQDLVWQRHRTCDRARQIDAACK